MSLKKYKLGELIQIENKTNVDEKYGLDDVRGISIQKIFIKTKANMEGVSLKPYIIVKPDFFAYVTVTSRNGDKITLAYNDIIKDYIVSSSYIVFSVARKDLLSSDYLFMYFNRPEFDRYARFHSCGSARETFSWEDMCAIDIFLPKLEIQQKYVRICNSLIVNQRACERGLEDLKLVCDGFIEDLRRKMPCEKIEKYIRECNEQNNIGLSIEAVKGIATGKEFIETKANLEGVKLDSYKLVRSGQIAYVSDTSRRGDKVSLAINDTPKIFLVSSISTIFSTDEKKLYPEYLMLYFSRSEFDRYARFNSWGSARESFSFEEMCNVEIPIPDIEIQKSIANIYKVYTKRKRINERLKAQIKNICPVLIKGAMEEGK